MEFQDTVMVSLDCSGLDVIKKKKWKFYFRSNDSYKSVVYSFIYNMSDEIRTIYNIHHYRREKYVTVKDTMTLTSCSE